MIKTIIFDLGGVYFTDGTAVLKEHLVKTYNCSAEVVSALFTQGKVEEYRQGNIPATTFLQFVVQELQLPLSAEELNKLWIESYVPNKETITLIAALQQHYELLYLSDNVLERVEFLQKHYDFLSHFVDGIFSYAVHLKKPDPKIYTLILEKTTSQPGECVFIDNKQSNLLPAQAIGMQTIHFTTPEQLNIDLQNLSVQL